MARDLTKKREIFATEYVKLDDASAAYRIAYSTSRMKGKTINEAASKLLKDYKVATRVAELKSQAAKIASEKFNTDSEDLLRHLSILRNARIDEYVNLTEVDGEIIVEFKPFSELTNEQLMCIESVKEGRNGIELKLHGKDWSIEKIAKHIGFYEKHNEQKKTEVNIFEDIDLSQLNDEELKVFKKVLQRNSNKE